MQTHPQENSVQHQLLGHFGLRENPFRGTPDPRFLFHSETHREALASLINGIDCEFGFQVLVAQPGMGKTTLLFNFLEGFRTTAHTAFLFQPQLEPHELLQSLLFELGAGSEDTSVRKLSEQINQLLGRAAKEHKRVIVVVDEAQNLDFKVLETLRQLSNFETAQAKLMQIVLAGQPQLVQKLAAPEQEQLRQRISTIGRLSPLNLSETRAYINHRLRTAGYKGMELFAVGAVRKIWESGKGVPRNINTLCFNAMLLGFAGNQKSIDESMLDEATRDLDMPSVLADMFRMEPSLVASTRDGHSNNRVQSIRETKPVEADGGKPANQFADQGNLLLKTNTNSAVAPSGRGDSNGTADNIPPALVDAIVRISQTLEEQKILLAAKTAQSAEQVPAASATAKATPEKSTPSPSGTKTTAAGTSNSSVSADKGSLRTPDKATPVAQKPAAGAASTSREKAAAAMSVHTQGPIARSYQPGAKDPSQGGGFWPKALALAAITGVLTFVVVEQSPWRIPARANAMESGQAASEQSDSGSGFTIPKGSPASPMDAPIRPSKNSSASRDSGSDAFDDVTVRKFPDEPADSTGGQDSKTIFFDQDSAVVVGRYRVALQHIADALAKDPEATAILEGHTDDTGPEAYNLDLSSRRAIAVREALINQFNVPSTQLTAIGSGAAGPVQPNSSPAGRAYNRRVAVRFVRLGE